MSRYLLAFCGGDGCAPLRYWHRRRCKGFPKHLQIIFGGTGFGILSGTFVLFVMILPTVTFMTTDTLRAVPRQAGLSDSVHIPCILRRRYTTNIHPGTHRPRILHLCRDALIWLRLSWQGSCLYLRSRIRIFLPDVHVSPSPHPMSITLSPFSVRRSPSPYP